MSFVAMGAPPKGTPIGNIGRAMCETYGWYWEDDEQMCYVVGRAEQPSWAAQAAKAACESAGGVFDPIAFSTGSGEPCKAPGTGPGPIPPPPGTKLLPDGSPCTADELCEANFCCPTAKWTGSNTCLAPSACMETIDQYELGKKKPPAKAGAAAFMEKHGTKVLIGALVVGGLIVLGSKRRG